MTPAVSIVLVALLLVSLALEVWLVILLRKLRDLKRGLEDARQKAERMHALTKQLHEDNRRLDFAIDARRRN